MQQIVLYWIGLFYCGIGIAQLSTNPKAFSDSKIINGYSNETLKRGYGDFRITHRFGDIGGSAGGFANLYGFDNAADIRIGFEVGLTDKLNAGFGRSKGSSTAKGILDGFIKYRLLSQSPNSSMPISLGIYLNTGLSTMNRVSDSTHFASFPKFIHRLSYASQLIITRAFGDRFSLAILPTWVHRNFAEYNEVNDIFAIGGGARIRLTKVFGILLEYYYLLNPELRANGGLYNPLGVGFELETGGHIFTLNFTNTRGILPNDFLVFNQSNIAQGEVRFGFTISRKIKLWRHVQIAE